MKLKNYADWDAIEYPQCSHGQHQSPVDLTDVAIGTASCLTFTYKPTALTQAKNPKALEYGGPTGHIRFEGERYPLLQFHIHHPAEHRINGRCFAMELHLVHYTPERGFVVVAVMIAPGKSPHPAYEQLLNAQHTSTLACFDPAALLPASTAYYSYDGSLTTPPCTENVHWVVLAEPVYITPQQLNAFGASFTGNNRPIQALNGRVIQHHR
ncbi:MAG: carbonic anhydrase family protein [Chloroflexota bacterium]